MATIIGIVGERLAGKDTVADYLASHYEAFHIKYSQILDEILEILDLPKSRRNEIDLGMAMRSAFHEGVLWGAIRKRITVSSAQLKVISSIRFQDEFDSARSLGAKMIYVTAPEQILYERFLQRKEKADDSRLSAQEFANLDKEPTEVKIAHLGSQCDFTIQNTGTLPELYERVDGIIDTIKRG